MIGSTVIYIEFREQREGLVLDKILVAKQSDGNGAVASSTRYLVRDNETHGIVVVNPQDIQRVTNFKLD